MIERAARFDWLGRCSGWLRVVAVAVAVVAAAPGSVLPATSVAMAQAGEAAAFDEIVLRSGRVIRGQILDESGSSVRMNVVVAGISAPATYQKSEILEIRRASERPAEGDDGARREELEALRRRLAGGGEETATTGEAAAGPTIYTMRLDGWFGTDISTPVVEDMLDDARKLQPDFLIIELDRRWTLGLFGSQDAIAGQQSSFQEMNLAFGILDEFIKEMPRTWEKIPHVVVWVKNAMGGAAFIPFIADTIFFHPDGRMGGIGNLGEYLDGQGDQVVRQKLRSASLAQAQGIAIAGGYDYRLVTAMLIREKVLSYRLIGGGRAELLERLPQGSDEHLLTADGTLDENRPSIRDVARGNAIDVLTLRADTALLLGVSSGTAETMDDVLANLGILRSHVKLDGRADRIMGSWQERLDRMARDLPRKFEEVFDPPRGTQADDRNRELGRQIRLLEEIRSTLLRYGDVLRIAEDFGTAPPIANGIPGPEQLTIEIETRRMEQIAGR